MNDIIYTISARGKKQNLPVKKYLETNFPNFLLNKIDSIFGFVEQSTLYSGRPFLHPQLSGKDIEFLYDNNIGVRIPFTNHFFNDDEYKKNQKILEKYHKDGNSLIITNNELAKRIKNDYPKYHIEASILKEIDTIEKIDAALNLYDTIVLPMNVNRKKDLLQNIKQKHRITLFGNAGCALTCPNRICYEYISKRNKFLGKNKAIPRYIYHYI
ncbi:MAG: hypothetical protein R6V23_08840 [Bacteroidales bacterium]